MSITDELRKWGRATLADTSLLVRMEAIADRIDAAVDGMIELPKDADGVPIHIGDEVYQVEGGWVYTVESITLRPDNTTVTFRCKHGFGCDSAHNVRHYHAPTVEDVLREFFARYVTTKPKEEDDAIIAEYAAKLKLAEGEDA